MQNDLSQFLASLVAANLARVFQVNVPPVPEQEAQPASMTREERNRLVLFLLDDVTPLIRNCARKYQLDYEEIRQDASIVIIRLLDAGIDDIKNLPAYVNMRVKSRMIDKLRYAERHCRRDLSLDTSISDEEDETTLADLLPSSYSMQPDATLIAKEDIAEALLWLPDFHFNTRRFLTSLGETAAASL